MSKSEGNPIKMLHSIHSGSDVIQQSAHAQQGPPFEFWSRRQILLQFLGNSPFFLILLNNITLTTNYDSDSLLRRGRDGSVGTATRYGLDGPEFESRRGLDFPHPSRPALGSTQPPIQWVPGLSRE